uniref:Uncharacterized protein n=1 Tax=Arundo donax TaxID=35708 RepID=A0A0A9ERN9_ARUDO
MSEPLIFWDKSQGLEPLIF